MHGQNGGNRNGEKFMVHVRSHFFAETGKVIMIAAVSLGVRLIFRHAVDWDTALFVAIGVSVLWILMTWVEFSYIRKRANAALTEEREALAKAQVELAASQSQADKKAVQLGEARREKQEAVAQQAVLRQEIDGLNRRLTELEDRDSDVAELWNPREQEAAAQWKDLNLAERELVRFVLSRGPVSAGQAMTHMVQQSITTPMPVIQSVLRKTSFMEARPDIAGEYSVRPEWRTWLEKLVSQERGQAASG